MSYVIVQGGTHAMLRRHAAFTGLAAEFVAATLLRAGDAGTLSLVRAGKNWITV
jgi:hypothetical protein